MKLTSILLAAALLTGFSLHAGTVTYTYDRAGRLKTATFTGGKTITYNYDTAGNQTSNVVTVPPDGDGDGMADSWETTHFGNTTRNGSGDFDNDGQTDFAEYLADTLPNNASSLLKITTFSTTSGVSAMVQWSSISNKLYRLEYKAALSENWTAVPGDITATSTTSSKTDTNVPPNVNRFYRITLLQ